MTTQPVTVHGSGCASHSLHPCDCSAGPHGLTHHTKQCATVAVMCAIENMRDMESSSTVDIVAALQDGTFADWALSYYDGLLDCRCGALQPSLELEGVPAR